MAEKYIIKSMQKQIITKILNWKYDEPYSFYNICKDDSDYIDTIIEFISGYYYSVHNENDDLIGYFCFGKSASLRETEQYDLYKDGKVLDIGFGLKPELTGQGKGKNFIMAILNFCHERFSFQSFRLTVASFNKRAIKVYKRLGFKSVGSFKRNSDSVEFIIMKKSLGD